MSDASTFGSVKQLLVVSEQQALARVLADAFAVHRLRALGSASLNAAALPTLVLWIDAWVRLPAPVVWLALVTWPACATLAIVSIVAESSFRRRLDARLPPTRLGARISFVPAALPPRSAIGAVLAGALGSLIWLGAVAPSLLAPEASAILRTTWALLIGATLLARHVELST
jgi:hypothetical protein